MRTLINPWDPCTAPSKVYPHGSGLITGFSPESVAPRNCLHSRGVKPWILKRAYLQDQGLHHLGQSLGVSLKGNNCKQLDSMVKLKWPKIYQRTFYNIDEIKNYEFTLLEKGKFLKMQSGHH